MNRKRGWRGKDSHVAALLRMTGGGRVDLRSPPVCLPFYFKVKEHAINQRYDLSGPQDRIINIPEMKDLLLF
jgi:hypothetical protein